MFSPDTHVLVVDDMMTMRKLVTKTCKELGFSKITDAADGALAWAAIQQADPPIGLIISDWNMPNCSGLDFLKKVRSEEKFAKTPFVLVTAEAESHQVAEAIKSGVDQYVVKPFTRDSLKLKLESAHKKCASRIGA